MQVRRDINSIKMNITGAPHARHFAMVVALSLMACAHTGVSFLHGHGLHRYSARETLLETPMRMYAVNFGTALLT